MPNPNNGRTKQMVDRINKTQLPFHGLSAPYMTEMNTLLVGCLIELKVLDGTRRNRVIGTLLGVEDAEPVELVYLQDEAGTSFTVPANRIAFALVKDLNRGCCISCGIWAALSELQVTGGGKRVLIHERGCPTS